MGGVGGAWEAGGNIQHFINVITDLIAIVINIVMTNLSMN